MLWCVQISDASFCNETITVDGVPEPGRSQQGYVICLAPADMANITEAIIYQYHGVRHTLNEFVAPR